MQRPDWNTVEEIAGWVRADGAGHAAFEVPVEKLAGKNLRVYAEARVVSPEPAYQETRTSPRPLSIVILNGAALDGSVRALRLTGEAPMRVTLFAEVNNRSWARDLGNVRWEMSTNGGEWQTVSNPSNAPQRLATTLQKGSYMIRAELTNKNSGAKPTPDANMCVIRMLSRDPLMMAAYREATKQAEPAQAPRGFLSAIKSMLSRL